MKNEVTIRFSKANLKMLLKNLIQGDAEYSHEDFANWIYRFHIHFIELFDAGENVDLELEELVNDIDAQWELNLANSYSPEELSKLDFSKVKFPIELLLKWNKKLEGMKSCL
ncbi:hypothetical protein [Flavobacterium suncheonense]|uniref:hypothetical protein n=1 Tax=Flavobacterium suncheonense TaxID=350894 RepID=UPI00042735AD|nr:hypothetical protein [Flavobacterium suncheonense]